MVQQRNMRNLLCQLNSLQEVGDLWLRHAAAHRLQYRSVIFLRPDVLYTDPLPVAAMTNITVCPSRLSCSPHRLHITVLKCQRVFVARRRCGVDYSLSAHIG